MIKCYYVPIININLLKKIKTYVLFRNIIIKRIYWLNKGGRKQKKVT